MSCCTARDVLWYLVFFGFAVNYMFRINLNIAIVSMVESRGKSNVSLTSECLEEKNISHFLDTNSSTSAKFNAASDEPESTRFKWDEKQQSLVLGAFFWLHWLTQVPGGILASKYGTKLVFGLSNFTAIVCCFFLPAAAFMGHSYIMVLRLFQGIVAGFAWPSMHNMTARWIPPNERSKFVTAYLGSSVGAALTYPACGFIIHRWGWEWVFYTSGIAGTIWYIAWYCLAFDSPSQHPRISQKERDYIEESLGQSFSQKKAPIPWKSILLSVSVWMNVLAQFGGLWGLFTLMTHAPTYFKFIHGWSIQATGILSGLGHVFRTTWAYLSALLGDYLLKTNKMSRTNVRKLATAGSTIGQGVFMFALAFCGCDYTWAIIFLSTAVAMNGSVSTGPLAAIVDLSPNYASVILGMVNSAAGVVGFITPAIVGQLTYQNQTVEQWKKVFLIASSMLAGSGGLYVLLAKAELQPWNNPDVQLKVELQAITKENEEENEDYDGIKIKQ